MDMLAVVRIRGKPGTRKEIADTLRLLGLKEMNNLAILPRTESILGMIKKTESKVAWGELSEELIERFKDKRTVKLKPPKGGLKSVRRFYPKGDLGYRGKEINELIKKMI
ncbi:MAG: uL30 family ribosomal protein [Candidatus Aenigmarchaeota archaeon]|nr:uL30 family ribosomal protein [Candidatus Aenigmarchaeota archaeon]